MLRPRSGMIPVLCSTASDILCAIPGNRDDRCSAVRARGLRCAPDKRGGFHDPFFVFLGCRLLSPQPGMILKRAQGSRPLSRALPASRDDSREQAEATAAKLSAPRKRGMIPSSAFTSIMIRRALPASKMIHTLPSSPTAATSSLPASGDDSGEIEKAVRTGECSPRAGMIPPLPEFSLQRARALPQAGMIL